MRTSGLSQTRTWMRPLRFSISTWPRASSGRVWLIGVAAHAAGAARQAAGARGRAGCGSWGVSGVEQCGQSSSGRWCVSWRACRGRQALGQLQAAGIGVLQAVEQEARSPDRAPARCGSARRCGRGRCRARRRRRSSACCVSMTLQRGLVLAASSLRLPWHQLHERIVGSCAAGGVGRSATSGTGAQLPGHADGERERGGDRERREAAPGRRARRRRGRPLRRGGDARAIDGHRSWRAATSRRSARSSTSAGPRGAGVGRLRCGCHASWNLRGACAAGRARDATGLSNCRPPCRVRWRSPRASSLRRRAAPAPRGPAAAGWPRALQIHRQRGDMPGRIDAADGRRTRPRRRSACGRLRRERSSINAVLTASRCSQVLNALSKRYAGQRLPGAHEGFLGQVLGAAERGRRPGAGSRHGRGRYGAGTGLRRRSTSPAPAERTSAPIDILGGRARQRGGWLGVQSVTAAVSIPSPMQRPAAGFRAGSRRPRRARIRGFQGTLPSVSLRSIRAFRPSCRTPPSPTRAAVPTEPVSIRQEDLIQSVADALQYISLLPPGRLHPEPGRRLRARGSRRRRRTRSRRS